MDTWVSYIIQTLEEKSIACILIFVVWPPLTLGPSVCSYVEAAPLAVLGLFEIIKKQAYVAAVKLKLFRHTFRFPGKGSHGDQIPRDVLDSFPGMRNRGDQTPRDMFDSFPGKKNRVDQIPGIHWKDFQNLPKH